MGGDENDPFADQIAANNAELERQRQAMVQRRIDIIKSQGAPVWTNPNQPKATDSDPFNKLFNKVKG